MLQNLKNFLIAFLTGIVVFGICAVLILSTFTGDKENVSDDSAEVQEQTQSEE